MSGVDFNPLVPDLSGFGNYHTSTSVQTERTSQVFAETTVVSESESKNSSRKRKRKISTPKPGQKFFRISIDGKGVWLSPLGKGTFRQVFRVVPSSPCQFDGTVFKKGIDSIKHKSVTKSFEESLKARSIHEKYRVPTAKMSAISIDSAKYKKPSLNVSFASFEAQEGDTKEIISSALDSCSQTLKNWSFEQRGKPLLESDLKDLDAVDAYDKLNPNSKSAVALRFIKQYLTITGKEDLGPEVINDFYFDNMGFFRRDQLDFVDDGAICQVDNEHIVGMLDAGVQILDNEEDRRENLFNYLLYASRGKPKIFEWLISDFCEGAMKKMLEDLAQVMQKNNDKFPFKNRFISKTN